ncbi:MAG: FAD:protein FMN transferase [Bacteroidetes bacterium]|nr:FAD:protein FMN transferase [Bacteroidota bacterium]
MKRYFLFGSAIITGFFSCNPDAAEQLVKFSGEAQGTYYTITYYTSSGQNYQEEIDSILNAFDQSVSVYKASSIISRINNNDTTVIVDNIFVDIFNHAKEVSDKTGGAFDMTIGPLVNAWGFGTSPIMKTDTASIDSLRKLVNYKAVRLSGQKVQKDNPGMRFDFNAIAQGYTVDVIARFLDEKGISAFLVDIGGEVYAKGHKPGGQRWRVGIEKPAQDMDASQQVKAIVELENEALSTSGNYRKYYEKNGIRYSHTIDPSTGYPVTHTLLSVSVKAKNCWTADAYATAFMVMGLEKSKKFLEQEKSLDAYFIFSDQGGNMKSFATEGIEKLIVD